MVYVLAIRLLMSSEELNSILPLEIRQIIFAADFPLRNLDSCVGLFHDC